MSIFDGDHVEAGLPGGEDGVDGILKDGAVGGFGPQTAGSLQKDIGAVFARAHLHTAEDEAEIVLQPQRLQTQLHQGLCGGGGHAHGNALFFEGIQIVPHAGLDLDILAVVDGHDGFDLSMAQAVLDLLDALGQVLGFGHQELTVDAASQLGDLRVGDAGGAAGRATAAHDAVKAHLSAIGEIAALGLSMLAGAAVYAALSAALFGRGALAMLRKGARR